VRPATECQNLSTDLDYAVARKLQMALTAHIVSAKSYRLVSLKLKRYQNMVSKLKGMALCSSHSTQIWEAEPTPEWIELWIEKPPIFSESVRSGHRRIVGDSHDSTSSTSDTSRRRRANRQANPGKEVPRGRVVAYCRDRIYIIPCEQTVSLCLRSVLKSA
jgi:hypothetical protein